MAFATMTATSWIHCTFGPKMSQAGTLFWTFIIELSIVSSLDLSKQDPQLTEVPNRIPANVTLLNLARNEIAGINNTDLTNIDFLIQLDVSHNRLETFPSLSKFFDTLEILNLNHNNITDVPATSLQGFSSLQTLDLADNRLSQWPLLDVSHSSLTSLNLKGNKISEPNSNFPSNIQILDMSNNGIKLIPSTFYQNLPNLTHLTLSQNNIALFPDVTLLPELLAVVMDYNSLRELPDFSGISTKLEVITAKENAIVSLDHPLPNTLQTLDLYSNKITSISDSCFSETENITWINLAQNEIANFPMFKRNVTHLWHLTLNNNPLEEFNFDRLRSIQTGLTEFSINGNKLSVITYLPPTLEKLSLGYSEVYVEAEVWSTLTELKSLNIDHGVLKVFPDISALKSLVYLYCTESNIEAVNFDNFQHTHLSNIHLNRNRISSSLSYVPKTATYLRLDENYITHIAPDAFTNCIRLTHVYLSHNQLTGFPRLQTELPNLQTITIAHNQLTKFHFNDFATASHVDLAANQISAIHQDGFDLTQSTQTAITIHLGNNPLSTLPLPKLAASLQKVVIHAMGNPLVCDEHMAWIPRIQTRVSLLGTCVTPTSDTAQDVNSINWNAIKVTRIIQGGLDSESNLNDEIPSTCTAITGGKKVSRCSPTPASLVVMLLGDYPLPVSATYNVTVFHTGHNCSMDILLVYASLDSNGPMQCHYTERVPSDWLSKICLVMNTKTGDRTTECVFQCPAESRNIYVTFAADANVDICHVYYELT